tara:strand:- start:4111 stop:5340 length:1230 start_codon:yes stop_codon:yes gene_type:complete
MKRLFLHFGRHKCGTTSIQKTLYHNRSKLLESGFYYPLTGIRVAAHHEIAEALGNKMPAEREGLLEKLYLELKSEIQLTNCRNVIISSEQLQSCNPALVASFFRDFDVIPVCYLREQAAYLRSSYLQKVHATDYAGSVEQFYQEGFSTDYRVFLEKWQAAFDRDISVRVFDRGSLTDGDAVRDFLIAIMGLTKEELENLQLMSDENPSLSREMLAFKLEYNARGLPNNGTVYFGLGKLSKAKGSKYEIPLAITDAVRQQYAESNRWVEDNVLTDGQTFSYPLYEGEPLEKVSPEQFDAILEDLNAMKEREKAEEREREKKARQLARQQIRAAKRQAEKEERQRKRRQQRQTEQLKEKMRAEERERRAKVKEEKEKRKADKEKQKLAGQNMGGAPRLLDRVASAFNRRTK